MDIIVKLALWVHFAAIGLGGSAAFGIPVLVRAMPSAPVEARPTLGAAALRLSVLGRVALGLLVLSGLVLVWGRYGGIGELRSWFWAKMTVVVLFIGLVHFNLRNGAKARAGDQAAAARAPMLGMIGIAMFLLIVLTAVLAFL